jgi:subtilisin family serine protease
MPDALSKMDNGLREIFANYHYLLENGRDDPGWLHPILEPEGTHIVPAEIRYTGNLATLVENGLTIIGEPEDDEYVEATVDLDFLEAIGANPQILEMNYGDEPTLSLDGSTVEINARKNADPAHPFVWDVNKANGAFSGSTGDDVIIGMIDSGIDFKHPVFLKNATETRILRIWDQGLVKQGAEQSPNVSTLAGTQTYGVEYTEQMINNVLKKVPGALPIRHRDCLGHGTHVASTAAGDGRATEFLGSSGFEYVGVAPKASIIMVKFLTLQTPPPLTTKIKQFEDAVSYILKTAQSFSPAKPVVINCSIGSDLGPHDGMEKNEIFLTNTFNQSAGQACVVAAGNASDKRQHAIITIPAAGSIEVPFELEDPRTLTENKITCVKKTTATSRNVEFWYGNIAPAQVKFSVKIPNATAFTTPMALGDASVDDKINHIELVHKSRRSATPVGGAAINRNNFTLTSNPFNKQHNRGSYTVKIEGPANTSLHVWCQQGARQDFKVLVGNNPAPPGVNLTDLNTIGSLGCAANVITVAAYNDVSGLIAKFSSQGPLVKYAGNTNAPPEKPDIAAPGVSVNAAKSANHDFPVEFIKTMLGFKYLSKNGTSMAAPHIAGVVALMLQKTKTLKSNEIMQKLKTFIRTTTPPTPLPVNSFGKGKVDAKKVLDNS